MRESWTDKRLDEFRSDVNERFGRVEDQIQGLRTETKEGFDAMHRLLIRSAVAVAAALLAAGQF